MRADGEPLLALISVVAVPVSFYVTLQIAKRSQIQFANQWRMTGEVDGYIEEVFTGHSIVKVFGGKRRRAERVFDGMNRELYDAPASGRGSSRGSSSPRWSSSNLNYVAIAWSAGS